MSTIKVYCMIPYRFLSQISGMVWEKKDVKSVLSKWELKASLSLVSYFESTNVSDKLPSDMSCRVVGCKFCVHESTKTWSNILK